ncbi:MAG: ATP-binding protein [Nitrospiria bacterium]
MNTILKRLPKLSSISSIIALITFVGGTLFAFIIAGFSYQIQHINETEDFLSGAHRITDQMGLFAGILLEKKDIPDLQKMIEQFGQENLVIFSAILDRNLNVIASNQKSIVGLPISNHPRNFFLNEELKTNFIENRSEVIFKPKENMFEMVSPIHVNSNEPVQYVLIITFLDNDIFAEPKARFWSFLKLASSLTAVAMIIFYFLLRQIVSIPLNHLIHATERLGEGELGVQIPAKSSNEIRKLTNKFNQVSLSLASQQKALKASEERYLNIFHFFPIPLILIDSKGHILNVNSAYLSQTRSPIFLKVWEQSPVFDIPLIRRGNFQKEIQQLLDTGKSFKLSKVPIIFNERLSALTFNISGIPLFKDQTGFTGAFLAIEDITLQQNLETQLIQSQKLESLGVLSGGIAHDFNNILTGILGYAQLLKEQLPIDDFSQKALKVIEKSSFRARDLIQQMIGFATWHPLSKTKLEINSFVSNISSIFQKSLDKDIFIQTELFAEPCWILADENQLHQALLNLCINARDALQNDSGKIILKTGRKFLPLDTNPEISQEYVEITVQDNGIGIEAEVLEHIFEPFFTTKDVGKGTGLGLSVTYGIVKANDGNIFVFSEPGKGTAFSLQFPLMNQVKP